MFVGARVAAALAIAGLLFVFVRGLDGRALRRALEEASILPLVAAALLCLFNLFCKACAWRVLLHDRHSVPVFRLFRYTLAAFAGSLLVPARAGEALRVWLLRRRDGVPLTTSTATALSEKLLDGVAMILTLAPLLFFSGLPSWVGRSIGLLALAAFGIVGVLLVVRKTVRSNGLVGRLVEGLSVLSAPRTTLLALLASLVAWLADLAAVLLVLRAVGAAVGPEVGLLVLLCVNVAILLPTTPGNLGSHEVGAMIALDRAGVPPAAATAFAILYHGVQVVPLLLIGLADVRLLLWARRGEPEPGAVAVEPRLS